MKSSGVVRYRHDQSLHAKQEENYLNLLRIVLNSNLEFADYKDKVLGFLRSRRYDLLLDFADSLGETEYLSAAQHYAASQLAALIKKYPFPGPILGVDPEKKAIEVFHKAERLCRRYNLIFRLERKLKRRRACFLRDAMRNWISKVIGEKPNFQEIWPLCGFGPGASVGVSGNATHLARKYLEPRWSVTPSALPYALAALRSDPHVWELLLTKERPFICYDPLLFEEELKQRVHMVHYNKITLVPKTSKVHRTIAVEPLLNGYVQKGIDEYIRRRLFRHGIDLKDQTRNQRLARLGSLPGLDPFATIDLSSASDLISLELARDILPPDWFELLNSVRSPAYKLGNTEAIRYEKFVSMGNGFCFPLETLIFSSVCAAVYERHNYKQDFSVYGDDIIVRSSLANEVLQMLRLIGFRHNSRKTFTKGPFRESCGADWYHGEDVRPVTLDYALDSLSNIIKLHNLTLRKSRPNSLFHEARDFLRALIPPHLRYCRPYEGQVDTAFEVELDQFMASKFATWNRKTFSWKWYELVAQARSDTSLREKHGWSTVLMIAALGGSSSEAPFTKRRNTRTRVRVVSHHGGYSTWLPSPTGHC